MYLVSKQPPKSFNTPFNRYNSTQTTKCAIRGAKIKIENKRKAKYSGNPYVSSINSENTVKHDQHKGPTTIIITEAFHPSRLPQNLGEPGTADQRGA